MSARRNKPITKRQFVRKCDAFYRSRMSLMASKMDDYSRGQTPFQDFYDIAKSIDATPLEVWAVYATKHWRSVLAHIADRKAKSGRRPSESIDGRIADLMNYLDILRELLK